MCCEPGSVRRCELESVTDRLSFYYYCHYYYFIRSQTWNNKRKINIKMKKAILIINMCTSDRVNKCL